jgi:uncharacterized membrane protein
MELLAALLILTLLAIRGRPLGLAIYAVTPAIVVASTDGSNDTTASLLILAALLTALRAPLAGAVLLAVAAAFKPYALAWLPALIAYAGAVGPLLVFVGISVILWGPPLLAWGPQNLWWSFRRAEELHAVPYYSLAYGLGVPEAMPRAFFDASRVAVGVFVAAASFLLVRSAASFIIVGALTFAATLFLGWWATFAYVSALAPIICWHIDDWLGLGSGRVIWPGDPVAAMSERVDARWPIRRPAMPVMPL